MNIQQTRTHLTKLETDLAADALSQDSLTAHSISLYQLIERLMQRSIVSTLVFE